jgi:hypothetical protein
MNERTESALHSRAEKLEVHHVYFDRYGALDEVHGQNDPAVVLASQKKAYCTLEGPGPDAHSSTGGQKGMGFYTQLIQPFAQICDQLCGQRRWMTVEANQVHDTWNLQHVDAVTQRKKDKYVAGKQRCVESHAPILPAPNRFVGWEKMVDTPLDQLRGS